MPESNLRVWWIPQVPGKPFRISVESVSEGVKLMDALARYDLFQFRNRIKPDYRNAGGLEMYDKDRCEWVNWYDEASGEDNPNAFLESLAASNP